MTHTTNYNLNKFEAADRVTRDGFNQNADRIDAAIKAASDAAAGGVRVETGTYIGTGTYGNTGPNTLTFSGRPVIVFVVGANDVLVIMRGSTTGLSINGGGSNYVTWRDDGISWFSTVANPSNQMNYTGATYYYYAFLLDA